MEFVRDDLSLCNRKHIFLVINVVMDFENLLNCQAIVILVMNFIYCIV